jgi:hypothetical protein
LLSLVVAIADFVQIEVHILFADMMKLAVDSAFDDSLEGFNSVGVNRSELAGKQIACHVSSFMIAAAM